MSDFQKLKKKEKRMMQSSHARHTYLSFYSRDATKPGIPPTVSLVELSTNARVGLGRINADALLVTPEFELAGADLTTDELAVVGFGGGLWDCCGVDGGNDEEENGEEFHFFFDSG